MFKFVVEEKGCFWLQKGNYWIENFVFEIWGIWYVEKNCDRRSVFETWFFLPQKYWWKEVALILILAYLMHI